MDTSCPCKNKNSQETLKSLRKFLEPSQKPKVIYTGNSLEFGNYHGIIEQLHLNNQRTNGIAERAFRRVKEGTSAVLLQSGLDGTWWSDSMECFLLSAKRPRPPGRLENSVCTKIWGIFQRTNCSICLHWCNTSQIPGERETKLDFINSYRKYCQESV